MEWVETTGRTLEAAKEAALDRLGVDEADAEFQIVSEPRTGLFGMLRGEARVRARVRPTAPRPKQDGRDRRRRRRANQDDKDQGETGTTLVAGDVKAPAEDASRSRGASAAASSTSSSAAASSTAGARSTQRSERSAAGAATSGRGGAGGGGGGTGGGGGGGARVDGGDGSEAPAGSSSSRRRSRRRRSGGGQGTGPDGGATRPASRPDSVDKSAEQPHQSKETEVEVALEEQAAVAKQFLDGLVAELGVTAEVSFEIPGDDVLQMGVEGPDLGLLIGQKGSTLMALQDLTRTVVQRRTGATNGRLLVDVAGYRHKRAEALTRFSQQVAEQVKAEGRPKALEPMNAADRKVVHDTINAIAGVTTTSEGEDPRRYVVVLPEQS